MGGKQLGFGDYDQITAKKRTKCERLLAEMEAIEPWKALIDLIEACYTKTCSKGGHPPYPLGPMLRIHPMQQWYDLSDPGMEDALIEVPTMRRFAGIDLISDRIPDETTILAFRHLLEKHDLGDQIFEAVIAAQFWQRWLGFSANSYAPWWLKWSEWRGIIFPGRGGNGKRPDHPNSSHKDWSNKGVASHRHSLKNLASA
jgi:hypothetical protein